MEAESGVPVTMEEESGVPVDVVEEQVDKLVLSIFEAMRCQPGTAVVDDVTNGIVETYNHTFKCIDNLLGMEKTKQQQETLIAKLSKEYAAKRESVLELESELLKLNSEADTKLNEVCSVECNSKVCFFTMKLYTGFGEG